MAEFPEAPAASPPGARDRGTRLDSWKEMAAYLQRDVRTLQRWEKTAGLPVRRMQKPGLRAVYAYTADLDEWLRDQDPRPSSPPRTAPTLQRPRSRRQRRRPRRGGYRAGSPTPAPFGPFTAKPITYEPGNERDPDISPDGKYVAYAQQART